MPTHYKGTAQEITALNAYIKLIRATESLLAHVSRVLNIQDLTLSQFSVLEVIYHLGPMSQVEIGKKILKTGGNITHVIDILEKRKLVERCKDAQDRRYYIINLTEPGKNLIKNYVPKHVKSISEVMNILNKAELDNLGRICKKLGTNIPAQKDA